MLPKVRLCVRTEYRVTRLRPNARERVLSANIRRVQGIFSRRIEGCFPPMTCNSSDSRAKGVFTRSVQVVAWAFRISSDGTKTMRVLWFYRGIMIIIFTYVPCSRRVAATRYYYCFPNYHPCRHTTRRAHALLRKASAIVVAAEISICLHHVDNTYLKRNNNRDKGGRSRGDF